MGVKEDRQKPLKEFYASFPEKTQEWIDAKAISIWKYFILWCLIITFSCLGVLYFIDLNPLNEPVGTWFQRSGSLISLLSIVSEILFLLKLKNLIKVTHYANLSCEIYIERKFKPHLFFSLALTFILVVAGTIIWGYGDILCFQLQ